MTEKKGKIWGTTQRLFKSGSAEGHYIEARAGGYCSRHKHQTRTNQFFVVEGRLAIALWEAADQIDITILGPGEQATVPIGQDHLFMALMDTRAIEIYEARSMSEDIERKWQGGFDQELEGINDAESVKIEISNIERRKRK